MRDLIYRAKENNISGYKQIIEKTYSLLSSNYDLIPLNIIGQKHKNFESKNFLNKQNFFSQELLIAPLELDRENKWEFLLPDKDNINVLTMWESSLLPRFSVKELNSVASKVFVPSLWNKECFEFSGVKNVHLLNLFVDDQAFHFKPKRNLEKFTFFAGANLSSFEVSNVRKDITVIIDSFLKTFKNINDVELVIKCTSANKHSLPFFLDERIKICAKNLPLSEFSDLFAESDVFVSSSKSEGWGFFQIESLATGRPVITVDYGGVKDFCNESNSFFIDYEEELATNYWAKSGGLWAKLNKESLCEQMFHCYKNKDLIRNNWQRYSQSVLPKFSIESYKKRLIQLLEN